MEREVRFGLNRERIQNTTQASVRTQFYDHAVEQERVPDMGSANLMNSLASFFGMGSKGLQAMTEAEHKREMYDIMQRKNPRDQAQAQADALAGKEVDPSLKDDLDYAQAYTVTKAQAVATKASADFAAVLSSAKITDNFDTLLKGFVDKEFGGGTGDPLHDATMLSQFKKTADQQRMVWEANQRKQIDIDARNTRYGNIASEMVRGDLTPESYQNHVSVARSLDLRHSPDAAEPDVMTTIVSSATSINAPSVSKLMRDTGFATRFPKQYEELENKLTSKFRQGLTVESADFYNDIRQSLAEPGVDKDVGKLGDILTKLVAGRGKYGADDVYTSLYGAIRSAMEQATKGVAGFNQFALKMDNPGDYYYMDKGEVDKYQFAYLRQKGFDNPLASPEVASKAAAFVAPARAVASDLATNMKQALTDTSNPNFQINSFAFWSTLDRTGKVSVKSEMGDDAYRTYSLVKALSGGKEQNVPQAFAKIAANPDLLTMPTDGDRFKWNTLLDKAGKKEGEALIEAQESVRKAAAETFGQTKWMGFKTDPSKVTLTGTVEDDLLADYGRNLTLFRRAGVSDPVKAAMTATMEGIGGNYMAVPRGDGKVSIEKNRLPAGAIVPSTQHVQLFQSQARTLADMSKGIFGDGSQVNLADYTGTKTTGRFEVKVGINPVMLVPGQEIVLGDKVKDLTGTDPSLVKGVKRLSNDPTEAVNELNAALPKGFQAEVWKAGNKPVIRLTYGFTDPEKTVAELEKDYAAKKDVRTALQLQRIRENQRRREDAWMGALGVR